MRAHLERLHRVRASETNPQLLYLYDGEGGDIVLYLDTIDEFDLLIAEAQKGRELLAAAQQEAVA